MIVSAAWAVKSNQKKNMQIKGNIMRNFEKLILILFGLGLVSIYPILGTLFGIFSGWFVGIFFAEPILSIVAKIGVKNVEMWQLGAFLGFVGGFFRSSSTSSD